MYIHNLNPVLINFGFFEVRWYSLAYIFGILIGWWVAKKIIDFKTRNKTITFNSKIFDDLISYIIISIIPLLPSGSFFSTFTSTFFWINYAIMMAYNKNNILR